MLGQNRSVHLESLFDKRHEGVAERRAALADAAARLSPSVLEAHTPMPDDPVAAAHAVPVPEALGALLPTGLRRGAVTGLDDDGYLAAALVGGAVAAGGSAALIGVGDLGVEAVLAAGADPERLIVVDAPARAWADAAEVLIGALDVVLLRPPGPVPDAVARRITARLRRGQARTALLAAGGSWPAPVRLRVTGPRWIGLADGHGQLAARRAAVIAEGRGTYGRPRTARVWLPAFDGSIRELTDTRALPEGPRPRLELVPGLGPPAAA